MSAKKRTARAIDTKVKLAEKEIDRTFSEILRAIDYYMACAPLELMSGDDASPGRVLDEYDSPRHSKFYGWTERWMGVLFPRTIEYQAIIGSGDAGDDEYMNLCYEAMDFTYLLGYFVGCRTMGASDDVMGMRAQVFKDKFLSWLRSDLEYQAKKKEDESQPPAPPPPQPDFLQLLARMSEPERSKAMKRALQVIKKINDKTPPRFDQPELTVVKRGQT